MTQWTMSRGSSGRFASPSARSFGLTPLPSEKRCRAWPSEGLIYFRTISTNPRFCKNRIYFCVTKIQLGWEITSLDKKGRVVSPGCAPKKPRSWGIDGEFSARWTTDGSPVVCLSRAINFPEFNSDGVFGMDSGLPDISREARVLMEWLRQIHTKLRCHKWTKLTFGLVQPPRVGRMLLGNNWHLGQGGVISVSCSRVFFSTGAEFWISWNFLSISFASSCWPVLR